jgi:hypothetical protein
VSKSDYLEVEVLKWCTGQVNALGTAPTPYIALYTANPSDAGGGTEVTGGSYARVSSAGKWAAPSAGSVSNNAEIAFATASAGWGTVTAFGLFDAVSGGNLLRWAALGASKAVDSGDTARFASSTLTFTED